MSVMRAFVPITDEELEQRKRLGLDRRDEMWEGVLHMNPAPLSEHQRVLVKLVAFLDPLLTQQKRGQLLLEVNVFDEQSVGQNYRIPDLSFLSAGREALLTRDGVRGGGPDVVIEIRSPDDETYDKFPFFIKLGIPEVVVIDRDSKIPEVYRLAGSAYDRKPTCADGWILCEPMLIELRVEPGAPARLGVRDAEDRAHWTQI